MLTKRAPIEISSHYVSLPIRGGLTTLVSPSDFPFIERHRLFVTQSSHCQYVSLRVSAHGKVKTVKLHVFIMNPPPGYEVHHRNRNTFDNRRENLQNLTIAEHRIEHGKTC